MSTQFRYADAHCDISDNILYAYPEKLKQFDSFTPEKEGWLPHQIDFTGIINSGIKLMVWSICPVDISDDGVKISADFEEFLRHVDVYNTLLKKYPDTFRVIKSAADLDDTFLESDRIGVVLHLEGMDVVQEVSDIQKIYDYGVRSFGLCGISSNHLGMSGTQHPENTDALSELGKSVIAALDEMPVAIDYAHLADGAFMDVAKYSKKPIYVSHTNCREVHFDGQNMTDKQLQMIAESGGLCGMSLFPLLLTGAEATAMDFVAHVQYAQKHLSVDNICMGSDFDGMSYPVMDDCKMIGDVQSVFRTMQNADFSNEDIEKIAFTNLFNYFKSVL